jgi:AcrR family transcriptional regulator
VGLAGSLDVTVGKIASRAGVSSALAHHYFGGKDALFLAAMRHILSEFGAQVLMALAKSETDTARVEAVIRASFGSGNFRPGLAFMLRRSVTQRPRAYCGSIKNDCDQICCLGCAGCILRMPSRSQRRSAP